MDINPYLGKKYASGEYNYLENYTEVNGDEPILYEDDVVYIINSTNCTMTVYSVYPVLYPFFIIEHYIPEYLWIIKNLIRLNSLIFLHPSYELLIIGYHPIFILN
jgi:hypothetical protein